MVTEIEIAESYVHDISKHATCDRLHVGALILEDGDYLGSGYNREPKYMNESCDTNGHLLIDRNGRQSCNRTIHAEIAAIHNAIANGHYRRLHKATMFVTHHPCDDCKKMLLEFGITKVYYFDSYNGETDDLKTFFDIFKKVENIP